MNRFRLHLLRLIHTNDGQFSWYQIERELSSKGVEREEHLMQSLNGLESDGYIIRHVGMNPSQPTYSITAAGIIALTSIPTS